MLGGSLSKGGGEKIEGMKGEDAGLETDSPDLRQRLLSHTDGDYCGKFKTEEAI